MRGIRIEAGDVAKRFAAGGEKDVAVLQADLLQRLEAVRAKAGTDNMDIVNPVLAERPECLVSVGLEADSSHDTPYQPSFCSYLA